ncbi:MAG: ice-binding family protein [Patescibacteria group bacterium]
MKNLNKNILTAALTASLLFGLAGPAAVFGAGPATVNLGASGGFAVLAKTGVSTTGGTSVVGDIGLSPAAASYITGFGLILPAAGAFSMSSLVIGKVYAPDYANPTPANLTTAVLDMQAAYTDAAGRAPSVTELGAGNIGGLSLVPGVYKWGTNLTIPADVTLSGNANDVWIFQVAQNLTVSSAVKIILAGGARADNVFWVVAGQTTLGTTSVFNGNILDQTTIVLNTGAQLNGRALAQAAVTLDSNVVTVPSSAAQTPTPAPTPAPAPQPTPVPAPSSGSSQVVPPLTSSNTALRAELNRLLAVLQTLQMQARGLGAPAPASTFGQQVRAIANDLQKGNRDDSVAILQQFLMSQNKGPNAQALAKAGATAYFGSLTRAALAEFQKSVGISPALGNFGAITRAYLKSH